MTADTTSGPEVDLVAPGAQLRRVRAAKGVTRSALAAGAGLDERLVRGVEAGREELDGETVAKVAEFLGVSPLGILAPGSLLARMALTADHCCVGDADRSMHDAVVRAAELHRVLVRGGHPRPVWDPQPAAGSPETAAERVWRATPWRQTPKLTVESLAETVEDLLGVDVMVDSHGPGASEQMTLIDCDFEFVLINADHPNRRAVRALAAAAGRVAASRDPSVGPGEVGAFGERFAGALLAKQPRHHAPVSDADAAASTMRPLAGGVDDDPSQDPGSVSAVQTIWARPGRRPPSLLAWRCLAAIIDGTLSARPAAGLLGADPDDLLAALPEVVPASRQ